MFFELVIEPAAAAFLDVTIFVASMIGLFGLLQWRYGEPLAGFLARRRRAGPFLGAVAGVIPGCGGAVLVVPLYVRGQVSFGTVIAALVATMGDSSFVILATEPGLALRLHGVLFVTGLVCGYAVDAAGYAPRTHADSHDRVLQVVGSQGPAAATAGRGRAVIGSPSEARSVPEGTTGGGGAAAPVLRRARGVRATAAAAPALYWLLVTLGALLVLPVLLRPEATTVADGLVSGTDIGLVVGLAGTGSAVALVWSEYRAKRRGRPRRAVSEIAEVLRATAFESATVAVWVTVAFVGMAVVSEAGLSVVALATVAGFGGVVAGALLGLLPGCAPQVVLTGLYASGALPLPTLLANALSQDGDALLPLLLMERRSAVAASILTTIPGLVVGGGAVLLGLGG